jgi:hypothetical protein
VKRYFVAAAFAVFAATACAGGSRSVVLEAGAGSGTAELTATIDGEQTTERIDGPWRREIDVEGEFSVSLAVVDADPDPDGGGGASCAILVDGVSPVEIRGVGEANCRMSGSADGDSLDVRSSASGGAAPTTVAVDPPEEAVIVSTELGDGAFTADIASTFEILDIGRPTTWGESGILESRELDVLDDANDVVAVLTHPDGSFVEIKAVRVPLRIRGTLSELGAAMREQVNPNGRGREISFGPTEFAGVDAFEYSVELDDRTLSWFVYRLGTYLFTTVGAEYGDSGVDALLRSIRGSAEALRPLSHSTTVGIGAIEGYDAVLPTLRVPADVEMVDAETLTSPSLDLDVRLLGQFDPPPIREIITPLLDAGYVESSLDVDGVDAILLELVVDDRLNREVFVPVDDGLLIELNVEAPSSALAVLDEIIASLSVLL